MEQKTYIRDSIHHNFCIAYRKLSSNLHHIDIVLCDLMMYQLIALSEANNGFRITCIRVKFKVRLTIT